MQVKNTAWFNIIKDFPDTLNCSSVIGYIIKIKPVDTNIFNKPGQSLDVIIIPSGISRGT